MKNKLLPKVLFEAFLLYMICFSNVSVALSPHKPLKENYKIVSLNANSLNKLFNSLPSTQPSVIVIFTSWCNTCARKFPIIVKTLNNYPKVNKIVISLDNNVSRLKNFLSKQDLIPFNIYNIVQSQINTNSFQYNLQRLKINFDFNVPYAAVLDQNKTVIMQGHDLQSIEKILNKISKSHE